MPIVDSPATLCAAAIGGAIVPHATVEHIRQVLDERETHAAPRGRFEFELQDHLNPAEAETTLRTVIGWRRYAEPFTYDDRPRSFGLPV
jgi:hypothetical protein